MASDLIYVLEPGGSVDLSVSAGGGEATYIYQWYKDDVKIDNEKGWKSEYTATEPGVYKCWICCTYSKDDSLIGYGEQYSDNAIVVEATGELRITEQPQNVITAEGDYVSAANRKLTVSANSAYVPLSYQWQAQENGKWVDILDANDAFYVPPENGNYRVLVKDSAGQGVLSDVAEVDIKTWPLIILEQPRDVPMLKYEWVSSHWTWGRYYENMVRMAVTGGTGNYRFSLQVRDTDGDAFREVWWHRQEASLLEMPVWTSEYSELPSLESYFRDQGNGWAYVTSYGLTVNKPGVQYRIVAEEVLPYGSDRTPQRVESRVCTVRDITNAKRGETDILNLQLTYDSATDSLVTYIYGGTAPYTVRWKYRKWRIDGNGLLWYVGFESWELPPNENITVELTDFGAIVRYPGWSAPNTEPHVRVWDANGSEMETSILM